MKVLWLGGMCWNKDNSYHYPVTMPGAVSGSFFQQSIIEGIEQNRRDIEITLLTEYCSNFKWIIPKFVWSHNGVSRDVSIKVIQIPIINRISKTVNLLRECTKICKNDIYDIIVVYGVHTPYLITLNKIKK